MNIYFIFKNRNETNYYFRNIIFYSEHLLNNLQDKNEKIEIDKNNNIINVHFEARIYKNFLNKIFCKLKIIKPNIIKFNFINFIFISQNKKPENIKECDEIYNINENKDENNNIKYILDIIKRHINLFNNCL